MNNQIAALRALRGWTQAELSHVSGIDIGTISRIERGHRTMLPATARAFAAAFEVEVEELYEPRVSTYGIARDAAEGFIIWVKRCAESGQVPPVYAEVMTRDIRGLLHDIRGIGGRKCDELAGLLVYMGTELAQGHLPRPSRPYPELEGLGIDSRGSWRARK
jgi:transcriptional regulator with XRE-family HTH domain